MLSCVDFGALGTHSEVHDYIENISNWGGWRDSDGIVS